MPIHDWTKVSPGTFHDFHTAWIAELRKVLNQGLLPPGYYAMSEQVGGDIGPDVLALETVQPPRPEDGEPEGAVAVTLAPPPVRTVQYAEDEVYVRKRKTLV